MPDIRFSCPHCGRHLAAPPEMAGTALPCPDCEAGIVVPTPKTAETEEVAPPPPPSSESREADDTPKAPDTGQLHRAIVTSDVGGVRAIISSAPGMVNTPTDGVLPLHVAVRQGNDESAGVLLDHGADIDARDDELGITALQLALAEGYTHTVSFLRSRGAAAAECPHGHGPVREWKGTLRCGSCGWPEKNRLAGLTKRFGKRGVPGANPVFNETECPEGHGPLRHWEDGFRCWTCGWTELSTEESDQHLAVFFGALAREGAETLRKQLGEHSSGLRIVVVERAEEIRLQAGQVWCQLAFSHHLPGRRDRRSSEKELKSWGARLTAKIRDRALAAPTPEVNWFTSMGDSSVSLVLSWEAVETSHVKSVAQALQAAYAELGGRLPGQARPAAAAAPISSAAVRAASRQRATPPPSKPPELPARAEKGLSRVAVFVGAHAARDAAAAREELRKRPSALQVLAVSRAAEIELAEGETYCQLGFSHFVLGREGQSCSEDDLRGWREEFMRKVRDQALTDPAPVTKWYGPGADGSALLLLCWERVDCERISAAAAALESVYVALGGKPTSQLVGIGIPPDSEDRSAGTVAAATRLSHGDVVSTQKRGPAEVDSFRMTVEDVFQVTGKGTVATGCIAAGQIALGEDLELVRGDGTRVDTTCERIEMFDRTPDSAKAGEHAGLVLRGLSPTGIVRGDVLRRRTENAVPAVGPADAGKGPPPLPAAEKACAPEALNAEQKRIATRCLKDLRSKAKTLGRYREKASRGELSAIGCVGSLAVSGLSFTLVLVGFVSLVEPLVNRNIGRLAVGISFLVGLGLGIVVYTRARRGRKRRHAKKADALKADLGQRAEAFQRDHPSLIDELFDSGTAGLTDATALNAAMKKLRRREAVETGSSTASATIAEARATCEKSTIKPGRCSRCGTSETTVWACPGCRSAFCEACAASPMGAAAHAEQLRQHYQGLLGAPLNVLDLSGGGEKPTCPECGRPMTKLSAAVEQQKSTGLGELDRAADRIAGMVRNTTPCEAAGLYDHETAIRKLGHQINASHGFEGLQYVWRAVKSLKGPGATSELTRRFGRFLGA